MREAAQQSDDPQPDATDMLAEWLGTLPSDGTDSDQSRLLETELAQLLKQLDRGDDLVRRQATHVRTLMDRVNQRRASVRGEN